jgi:hypothetical protein
MNKHPIYLSVHFSLEISVLAVFGFWGWQARMG